MEAKISVGFNEFRGEREVLVMAMEDTPCMELLEKIRFIAEIYERR